ncbi:DNA replication regulator [Campylobacter sputorum subsp. sputorum]|uniref:DNA replication regulator n=1 Tax=Campylobacter sputorum subsp. sputorum TaxID=32024 RepID=A0A381DL27_9BACT|nr:HobA family DNA replication regulator [Campylobacter sputorum]SUX11366.1 DNA replication regulator [Campylobacter sputorum subsp. sputorum]
MMDFFKWTLQAIRAEGSMSWMEERREEWSPLLASRLKFLLDGRVFLLICDEQREWFLSYFLTNINRRSISASPRPLLPFFSLKSIYPNLDDISSKDEMALLDDLLEITFPNGFIYFYIGSSLNKRAQVAKGRDDSYMWLLDEQSQNGFSLNSKDENIDSKFLSLYSLFDKSVEAAVTAKVSF